MKILGEDFERLIQPEMDEWDWDRLRRQAFHLADIAHKGQADKAGDMYIYHPCRVADILKENFKKSAFAYDRNFQCKCEIVALLHDTLEDTKLTEDNLRALYDDEIVNAVVAITRQSTDTYFEFIQVCADNKIARHVKLADLEDNLNITRLLRSQSYVVGKQDFSRMERYVKAYKFLYSFIVLTEDFNCKSKEDGQV